MILSWEGSLTLVKFSVVRLFLQDQPNSFSNGQKLGHSSSLCILSECYLETSPLFQIDCFQKRESSSNLYFRSSPLFQVVHFSKEGSLLKSLYPLEVYLQDHSEFFSDGSFPNEGGLPQIFTPPPIVTLESA